MSRVADTDLVKPEWLHSKRAILELGRKLRAEEIIEYTYYGCERVKPISQKLYRGC